MVRGRGCDHRPAETLRLPGAEHDSEGQRVAVEAFKLPPRLDSSARILPAWGDESMTGAETGRRPSHDKG